MTIFHWMLEPLHAAITLVVTYGLFPLISAREIGKMIVDDYRASDSWVSAGPEGITVKCGEKPIRWESISAWYVTLPHGKVRLAEYMIEVPNPVEEVSNPLQKFRFGYWIEDPKGKSPGRGIADPRAAYQADAKELHALIVARTGLPLMQDFDD